MLTLDIRLQGLDAAQRRVASVPRQARFAAMLALNATGNATRDAWRAEMRRVFDRPTPYVVDAVAVTRRATVQDLHAEVSPRYPGGKGVDPASVLQAEAFGGVRRAKRFEVALRRAGILPNGMAAVPATWAVADPAIGDGYGGIKGSFIVRLLSYLQAFGEVGYRANMTERNRQRLSGRGRWVNGRFYGAHTQVGAGRQGAAVFRKGGVEYFVSQGRGTLRVSRRNAAAGRFADGQDQHLARGIWQRTGLQGADVKPLFLFVRMPRYSVRLGLDALAAQAREQVFPEQFRAAFRRAMDTAR